MSFQTHARISPDKIATVIAETGESMSYGELEESSLRFARLLSDAGLRPGDTVALMMENCLDYHVAIWGVLRSEMYFVTVSRFYTLRETSFLLADSDAQALIASHTLAGVAEALPAGLCRRLRLSVGGPLEGFRELRSSLGEYPAAPVRERELAGDWMLYSSGTTGHPLGIRRELAGRPFADRLPISEAGAGILGIERETVYLSPAPMHHSAPICYTTATHDLGGTSVLMERFNPESALRAIERYGVTIGQWVPSMFVRMLKLPAETRDDYDLSSQKCAVHAAAPCPISVKRAMIDWWGPILLEIYSSTEFVGLTAASSREWEERPGTVGKPKVGKLHICDEDGREVPVGREGIVYFERSELPFQYFKSPQRTAETVHPEHDNWAQVGDIGKADADGYLFLQDRASALIISGGVNVYPQEIENFLIAHPAVLDVAAIGIRDDELGEVVKAFVLPAEGRRDEGERLVEELRSFARSGLAGLKVPREFEIVDRLPRQETGKLYRRLLREREPAGSAD